MGSRKPIVVKSPNAMRRIADSFRKKGKKIVLVPTMGYLHKGHATLMKRGHRYGDIIVVSIFVNPIQFGPSEDLAKYPRDFQRDSSICEQEGVHYIFYPDAGTMYPEGFQTIIKVSNLEKGLCGDCRPGHFEGVATVVTKLFNIVKPHVAIFGEKDYQQLAVIKRMAVDLDMGIKIIGVPTVREPDGLAMSSRNVYLSAEERTIALILPRALREAARLFKAGERRTGILAGAALKVLNETQGLSVEYIEVRGGDLSVVPTLEKDGVILAAIRVGKTRLIDNLELSSGKGGR